MDQMIEVLSEVLAPLSALRDRLPNPREVEAECLRLSGDGPQVNSERLLDLKLDLSVHDYLEPLLLRRELLRIATHLELTDRKGKRRRPAGRYERPLPKRKWLEKEVASLRKRGDSVRLRELHGAMVTWRIFDAMPPKLRKPTDLRKMALAALLLHRLNWIQLSASRGDLRGAFGAALVMIKEFTVDVDNEPQSGRLVPGPIFGAIAGAYSVAAGRSAGPRMRIRSPRRCSFVFSELQRRLRKNPRLTEKELWNSFSTLPTLYGQDETSSGALISRHNGTLNEYGAEPPNTPTSIARASFKRYVTEARKSIRPASRRAKNRSN